MRRVLIAVALLIVVVLVTGCSSQQKRTIYQSEKILIEREGSLVTVSDRIGGGTYEIKVGRRKVSEIQDPTTARTVVSSERITIRAVYDLLIVTVGDDDPLYIRL